MDQLCSAREERSAPLQSLQELQRGQEPWAEQADGGWLVPAGWTQQSGGEAVRAE